LRAAVAHLEKYDWLVVTSTNGADALGREAQRQGVSLERMRLDVAAVGTGTAERLEVFGAPARHIPDAFTAFDLGKRIAQDTSRCRVLLVQGTEAPNELAQTLAAAGAAVERVDAYRMGVPHTLRKQIKLLLWEEKKPDAVTFTSPQIAKNFFDALAASELSLPETTVFAAIGPVTAQAMAQMGHPPHVIARESRMAALASALGDFFARRA
jgi:uroporphyrinogen-III synthase